MLADISDSPDSSSVRSTEPWGYDRADNKQRFLLAVVFVWFGVRLNRSSVDLIYEP